MTVEYGNLFSSTNACSPRWTTRRSSSSPAAASQTQPGCSVGLLDVGAARQRSPAWSRQTSLPSGLRSPPTSAEAVRSPRRTGRGRFRCRRPECPAPEGRPSGRPDRRCAPRRPDLRAGPNAIRGGTSRPLPLRLHRGPPGGAPSVFEVERRHRLGGPARRSAAARIQHVALQTDADADAIKHYVRAPRRAALDRAGRRDRRAGRIRDRRQAGDAVNSAPRQQRIHNLLVDRAPP